MFSFLKTIFVSQKKEETPKVKKQKSNEKYLELVQRWDDFLQKIEQRFFELCQMAEAAVMEALDESNFDIIPTQRAWHGMKSQIQNLSEKIDETWESEVEPKMEKFAKNHEYLDEQNKGEALSLKIYTELDRFETILEGKIAFKFYDHALKTQSKEFHCQQCGAELEIKTDVFRSHYVPCSFCHTTNTFTPNTKVMQIKGFALDNIARYNTLSLWEAKENAYQKYHTYRAGKAPQEALDVIETATKNYWEAYLKERIKLSSELHETYEKDLEARMKAFYDWKANTLKC